MLTQPEQALLDKHLKVHEDERRPLAPIDIDLALMSVRDLETYREATEFQMLGGAHEHLGDVELYRNRKEDIDAITRDEKELHALRDRLFAQVRDEKRKDRDELQNIIQKIDNLFAFRNSSLKDQEADERRKQKMAEWKANYFMDRIQLINQELQRKRKQEFILAFKTLLDAFLILIHAKRKPKY
jgi:hypothetical protein